MTELKRRLRREDVERACDRNEYGDKCKYPYINYGSLIKITSDRAESYDRYMYNNKMSVALKERTVYELRRAMFESGFEAKNDINSANSTLISKHNIQINNNSLIKDITYYAISHRCSSIKNGLIILVHGGGYCTKSPLRNFSFSELICKLTGCVCFILNYKLSPEYKLSYSIFELIEFYKYIVLNPKYKNISIAMEGDSCGGGMILSALQIIKQKYKSLSMPCCIWLNSPWTQLNIGKCKSHKKNKYIDGIVKYELLKKYSDWATGYIDGDLNIINNDNNIQNGTKLKQKYSAINGDFNGLCPMYFMVGATEMLLDDTLKCAKKAYDAGMDVTVDIQPYMLHVYAIRVNFFHEAIQATQKGCKWLTKHMSKLTVIPSKL